MIKSLTARNFLGEEVTITLTESEPTHGLIIKEITGLGPPNASISMTDFATDDGALWNSSRLETRTIKITFLLQFAPNVETSRQNTYKYFPIKKKVTLYFDTDNRYAKIDGYVKSNEPVIFSQFEEQTIEIVCDDPYFYSARDTNVTTFTSIDPLFEFEFENDDLDEPMLEFSEYAEREEKYVIYDGDAEIGVVVKIHVYSNPGNITIYNSVTQESMVIYDNIIRTITGGALRSEDEVVISTVHKNQSAYLLRNGAYTNIINAIERTSDWFQLRKGTNVFIYTTSVGADENISFTVENEVAYEGI